MVSREPGQPGPVFRVADAPQIMEESGEALWNTMAHPCGKKYTRLYHVFCFFLNVTAVFFFPKVLHQDVTSLTRNLHVPRCAFISWPIKVTHSHYPRQSPLDFGLLLYITSYTELRSKWTEEEYLWLSAHVPSESKKITIQIKDYR